MKKKLVIFFSILSVFLNYAFALNNTSISGTVGAAIKDGTNYLTYAMYAASVIAIISIGFMLFHNIQDTMLKHVTRLVALLSLLTLAFSVPTWFGLCVFINF